MTSISDGAWDLPATWNPNRVPLPTDDVVINHRVTIRVNIIAKSVKISALPQAGLTTDHTLYTNIGYASIGLNPIIAEVGRWMLEGMYPDNRIIDLTGLDLLRNKSAGISCIQSMAGFRPITDIFCQLSETTDNSVIMFDPQPLSMSAMIEETSNISATRQVARWKGAGIRKGQVTIQWPKTGARVEAADGLSSIVSVEAMLDRMVRQPFKVLIFTPIWILFGHITSVVPAQSGGQGWQAVTISITEG